MAGDNLVVSGIELDARDTLREIRRLDRRLKGLEGQVDDVARSTDRADRGLRNMGRAIAGAAAAFGAFRAAERTARFIFRTNVEFQKLEATLKTVTGSAESAAEAFDLITEFAKTTPFQVTEIVRAFTQLRVRGVDPTAERLRGLGNFAAAFTEDIQKLVNAIVSGAAGMSRPLKRAFGLDIQKDADQLRVKFEDIERTIPATTEALSGFLAELGNTRFADAMAERMETLDGKISNLEDVAALAAKAVGEEGLNDAIQDLVATLEQAIQDNEDFAERLGQSLASGVRVSTRALELFIEHTDTLVNALQVLATVTIARAAVPALSSLSFGLQAAAGGAVFLKDALVPLRAGMAALGGPAGVFALAIFGLHEFTKASDEAAPSVRKLRDETDELRMSFERLTEAQIQERIAAITSEIEERRNRMRELRQEAQRASGEAEAGGRFGLGVEGAEQFGEAKAEARTLQREVLELTRQLGILGGRLREKGEEEGDAADATTGHAEQVVKLIDRLREERDSLRFSEAELVLRSEAFQNATDAQKAQIVTILEQIESLELQAEEEEEAREAAEKRRKEMERQIETAREARREIENRARQKVQNFVSQVNLARIQEEFRRAEEAAEAFSRAITDPLLDVITETENVVDAFRQMVDGIIAELARLTVQRAISDLLSGFISGLAGGGIPDAPDTSNINPTPPKFQHGGAFEVGGSGGVDSRLVAFRATPGERVRVDPPGKRGRGGGTTNVNSRVELNINANDTRGFDELLRSRQELLVGLVRQGIAEGV